MDPIFNVCAHPCTEAEVEEWYTLLKGLQCDEIYFVTDCPVSPKMQRDGVILIPSIEDLSYFDTKMDPFVTVFAAVAEGAIDLKAYDPPPQALYIFGGSHVHQAAPSWQHDTVQIPCAIDTGYYSAHAGAMMLWDWTLSHG